MKKLMLMILALLALSFNARAQESISPMPATDVLMGDVNDDGVVDLSDASPFVRLSESNCIC